MAITIDQVAEALRGQALRFKKISDREILFLLGVGTVELKMVIQLVEDGEYLDVSAIDLGTCKQDHPRLEAVLEKLAHLNNRYKAVKFCWDPSDGEIRARIAIPFEDNSQLPATQLQAVIELMAVIVGRVWPEIQEALGQTGNPPSSRRRRTPGADEPLPTLEPASPSRPPPQRSRPSPSPPARSSSPSRPASAAGGSKTTLPSRTAQPSQPSRPARRRKLSPTARVFIVALALAGVIAVAHLLYRLLAH